MADEQAAGSRRGNSAEANERAGDRLLLKGLLLALGVFAAVVGWLVYSMPADCYAGLLIHFSEPPPRGTYEIQIAATGYSTKCQFERSGNPWTWRFVACSGHPVIAGSEVVSALGIPAKPPVVKVRLVRDGVVVIDHTARPSYVEGKCPSGEIQLPSFRVSSELENGDGSSVGAP